MLERLEEHPELVTVLELALLLALIGLAHWLTRSLFVRGLGGPSPTGWDSVFLRASVASRLAHIAPALVVYYGVLFVSGLPPKAIPIIQIGASAYMTLAIALAFSGMLTGLGEVYEARDPERARVRPIKSYLQIGKIVAYFVAGTLIVAMLFNRDPLLLLSGLGAMTAVLMLVFKDTIQSFVASVQLASHDMLRVGDRIQMQQLDADGEVIDITLHTVKVRNSDETITTIPTWRLIGESFRNWRAIHERGGRRIKRSLYLDQTSIRFLDREESIELKRLNLIHDYLAQKLAELEAYNASLTASGRHASNARRLTNVGTFRAYTLAYLRVHPKVRQDMDLLVRQLAPGPTGLPLEIYCFTSAAWVEYEGVQADIFDHLYAILPAFRLRVFQQPRS